MFGGFETRFAGQLRGGRDAGARATVPTDTRPSRARCSGARRTREWADGHLVLESTVAGVSAPPNAPAAGARVSRWTCVGTRLRLSPVRRQRGCERARGVAQQRALLWALARTVRQGARARDARAIRDGDLLRRTRPPSQPTRGMVSRGGGGRAVVFRLCCGSTSHAGCTRQWTFSLDVTRDCGRFCERELAIDVRCDHARSRICERHRLFAQPVPPPQPSAIVCASFFAASVAGSSVGVVPRRVW